MSFLITTWLGLASTAQAQIPDPSMPGLTGGEVWRTFLLLDYNTRAVVVGTTLLGMGAGVIGTFTYLRKRAMMGDALSHATLPGIAAVFLIVGTKQLALLLAGAAASGVLGVLCVIGLRHSSRLKEDAAIGIVLSVFFGAGMVLFSLVQQMNTGNEAGLANFIYGRAAAMVDRDAWLIGGTSLAVLLGCALLYKEFRLVCFDQAYAASQRWPVLFIDVLMMALVVVITVVGLQAVGLILIVALLIIPAAAARFWTDRLAVMICLAAMFGALSGYLGSMISALWARMPAGAVIVICAGAVFSTSMLLSPHRGIVAIIVRQWSLRRRVLHQHLQRAMAEMEESGGPGAVADFATLRVRRSWSPRQLRRALRRAVRCGELARCGSDCLRLTDAGRAEGQRVLRNHRLWELYLIQYADIAPSHVDRDADEIEHVLSSEIVRKLEQTLSEGTPIPPSPHPEEARS